MFKLGINWIGSVDRFCCIVISVDRWSGCAAVDATGSISGSVRTDDPASLMLQVRKPNVEIPVVEMFQE